MSLILDLQDIIGHATRMRDKASHQQAIYYNIVDGVVKLAQRHRLEKNYAVSDDLRKILSAAGVTVIQGTAGYEYDKIPKSLVGRPIDDTWTTT